jgi:hypothetical protein
MLPRSRSNPASISGQLLAGAVSAPMRMPVGVWNVRIIKRSLHALTIVAALASALWLPLVSASAYSLTPSAPEAGDSSSLEPAGWEEPELELGAATRQNVSLRFNEREELASPLVEMEVRGRGAVDVPGGRATFEFEVEAEPRGRDFKMRDDQPVASPPTEFKVEGHLQYHDRAIGANLRSTQILTLTIVGNTATFSGTCRNNGISCTFRVETQDNGEPGRGRDTFFISINNAVPRGGVLREGNIEIGDDRDGHGRGGGDRDGDDRGRDDRGGGDRR